MPIQMELNEGLVPVKIYTKNIDNNVLEQLTNLSNLSIIFPYIAVMPDVHYGIGATIGAVIPTINAIIPAAVGVDIGCGMRAIKLSLTKQQIPKNLKQLRLDIEKAIINDRNKDKYREEFDTEISHLREDFNNILQTHPLLSKKKKEIEKNFIEQIGSLGSGNHFIELCLDTKGYMWIMLHSGSRGIGNAIGRYFISLAKENMDPKLKKELPDVNLAYFLKGEKYFDDYFYAVSWAQRYAKINRKVMMKIVTILLSKYVSSFDLLLDPIDCHHNYINVEEHFGKMLYVARKGAISAKKGELGIVPGSMGVSSYIVEGLGNPNSFCSSAHGAGRVMSRTQAKKTFNKQDLVAQTVNVECDKSKHFLDEIPAAYKNIEKVMSEQNDLVKPIYKLKQFICVKQ